MNQRCQRYCLCAFYRVQFYTLYLIANPRYVCSMSDIKSLFATRLYHAKLSELGKKIDQSELEQSCLVIADDDEAGQEWCEENGYAGYTSYASLSDLPWRFPIFKDLVKVLDAHVAAFAKDVQFDLGDKKLKLEDIWINILPEGGIHTSHIHPHSVISGTTYVAMPDGASAIKFEDPRSAMMMAAPARRKDAPGSRARHGNGERLPLMGRGTTCFAIPGGGCESQRCVEWQVQPRH